MKFVLLLVISCVLCEVKWWKYEKSDCPGQTIGSVDGDTSALRKHCLTTPGCSGFNSIGELKGSECFHHLQHGHEHDLHIMERTPTDSPTYIWPLPQQVNQGSASILVDSNRWQFIAKPSTPELQAAFQRYTPIYFPHRVDSSSGLSSVVVTVADTNSDLQLYVNESYTLTVSTSGAFINAGTIYGAYRGLETLSQLIIFDFDHQVYQISGLPLVISDAPRFPHRGILIDTSRHFQPLASLKNIIDSLVYAKINTMHWHLVDSQSFPFEGATSGILGQAGSYSPQERYTSNDVSDIVAYAKARGIRVMVEVDMPGHAASWCKGHPEICPSSTCLEPLNPATDATFNVVSTLFDDLVGKSRGQGLFPENLMHLGGDEVNTDCWKNSASISKWMAEHNFTTNDAYKYFVDRVQGIAHGRGREVVGWEEIWKNFGTKLDKSTIIHQWLPGSKVAPEVTAAGYRLLWSTDGIWYLDGLSVSWKTMYSAEPCEGVAADACLKLVLGGEGCMWGETVDPSDLQSTIWPRMAAIAERLWSSRSVVDVQAAQPRYANFRCLLTRRGVAAAPYSNANARSAPPGPGSCYAQ